MQRRIEQTDCDRQSLHHLEDAFEIAALHRQQFCERRFAIFLVVRQNHLTHGENAIRFEEHVFGAAKPDAFRAELARDIRIVRRVGIRADLQTANGIRPAHQRSEIAGEFRLQCWHTAFEHLPACAIDGDDLAAPHALAAAGHDARRDVDFDHAGAAHAGTPHAPGHHGGMAGHAAPGGQDAPGSMHAVDILRAGLGPDQDDVLALLGQLFSLVRREGDLPRGRARRGGETDGDLLLLRLGVEGRMEKLVQRRRLDPADGRLLVDQAFLLHIHRDLERGLRRALARAGLQHEELAFLHREFHVLHIAVMRFQRLRDFVQFREGLGQRLFHGRLLAALPLAHDL